MVDKLDLMMAKWYFELVSTWRRMAEIVARAAKSLYPGAEVYVVGGAAEGRLTAVSDVDVVVVLPWEPSPRERVEAKLSIMREAFRLGLPLDYPVDLHVVGPRGFERYKILSRRVVRLA